MGFVEMGLLDDGGLGLSLAERSGALVRRDL